MKARTKLPEIRCDQSYKERVMSHAKNRGKSYAAYITDLINADILQSEGEVETQIKRTIYKARMDGLSPVTVMLPESMKAYLELQKSENKLSLSEQIRTMILAGHGIRIPEEREIIELMRTNNLLVAIGRNLNQLARKANSGEAVNVEIAFLQRLLEVVEKASSDVKILQKEMGL